MVSVQNLEFELQNLFKEKKFSEIILEITTKTQENERTSGLFVLLGISRISLNKKSKDQVDLAVSDFKKGYLNFSFDFIIHFFIFIFEIYFSCFIINFTVHFQFLLLFSHDLWSQNY